jgi:hypothetical protein
MNTSPVRSISSKHSSETSRAGLGAILLAAFILAVFAGSALAAGNLVKNGSFEKDGNGDGMPNNWFDNGSSGPIPMRNCKQSYAGSCSLKFAFDDLGKYVKQNIATGGNSYESYKLTFWVKTKQVVAGVGVIRIDLRFLPSSGYNYIYVPEGSATWTKYSITLESTADFTSMYIEILANPESGKAWFDKVKLVGLP